MLRQYSIGILIRTILRLIPPEITTNNDIMKTFDLICIGCDPEGEKTATQAAYFNHRVAVAESAVVPGGAMANTGTIPSIYAAGDVIGFPALAATSMEQGRVAACHMFDIDFKTNMADIVPIGIYTIPGISMVGLNDQTAKEKGLDVVTGTAEIRKNAHARMLGDSRGFVKCTFDRTTFQLLGATIIGENATELIHLAQFALTAKMGINDLINPTFNYPSLSESYKHAAYDALRQILAGENQSRLAA